MASSGFSKRTLENELRYGFGNLRIALDKEGDNGIHGSDHLEPNSWYYAVVYLDRSKKYCSTEAMVKLFKDSVDDAHDDRFESWFTGGIFRTDENGKFKVIGFEPFHL